MGPLFDQKRVQNPVSRTATIVPGSSLLPSASKSAIGRRSCQPPQKGGSGGDHSGMSGILFQNFPCSQKERETSADHRPLCAQSLCSCSELQNGDTEKSEKCHQPQRLGIFLGPDGCLFAYPDTLSVTQIPQVHVERSSVPVQGTSIRPLDQPFRFHSSYVRHSDVSKKKGNNSSSLSRRLVISKPKSSNTTGTQTIYPVSDQFSRSDYQLREIRPSSSSSVHIHRDGISDSLQYCQSPSVKGPEIIGNSKSFLTENLGISQSFPVSFGTTECSSGLCSTGTVTSPATTNVTAQSVEASEISVEPPSWYINENSTSPQMVATGRSLSSGSSSEDRSSLPYHIYGRQSFRLGSPCGTGGTSVSWSMDRRPIPAPHQHVRNNGGIIISNSGDSNREKLHSSSVHGQYNSGSLFKAPGRDSFPRPLCGGMGHSKHVLAEQHSVVSQAHSGKIQHSGGPAEQNRQAGNDRVVSKSGDSQCSYSTDGFSHYRPVRYPSESQVATLCVTYTGSKGTISRCSHNGLESHSCICVSSVPSYTSCDQQSTVIPVQNRTDSASMAQQTLVSRTPLSVGVTTGISSSNTKPACSAKRKVITSKSERPATSRLGIVKQSIRDKQFSSEVAEHVSQARRESTRKVYDAKWQIFRDWANQRKIDYIQASPQIVADFLTFLFTVKKCQVSTIKGYRSTISNTLKYRSGYDIGTHPVLSELIKSFQKQRPVQRTLAPKWDLAFVLTHICKAPFEPLHLASLYFLSVKTAFLLTMATARRVSEVHAFCIDKDHFRFSNIDGSLVLRTQPGFLAKNQLPSKAPDSITIPKLSNFCCKSDNFNLRLCPIRAVKIYLKRTSKLRKGRNRLFIPTLGDQDIHKSTISCWVKYAIKHAYNSIVKTPSKAFKPRAHELRALSASWAYLNFIPLEEILKSAVWSSSSLFASHYLRDFKGQAENLRAIGPIIAAQKKVGGQDNLALSEGNH